ncbi:MAG: sodium-dependent bicarbonate transport family permease [Gammaproteobacteria bacterium]|nr:sodium-dependent bicarbonate transport family permease [Gammaproteobacteria bacterium]
MDLILGNFLSAPVLFFVLGMLAVAVRSDLEIPAPIPKLLSLYLLFSIGFHGGVKLGQGDMNLQIVLTLVAAVVLAFIVPVYCFFILRLKFSVVNAAAVAAAYGSISAVTFIAADAFLASTGKSYGGHMVAAMALMESPAIIVGVLIVRMKASKDGQGGVNWGELMREACFNSSVYILLGSLLIGLITGKDGYHDLKPFSDGIFKGVLCFFLLDMGLVSARRISGLLEQGWVPWVFGILVPPINGLIGVGVAWALGLSHGDALMLAVLAGSASYIAVPAALRLAIPEANPGLYLPMALAITFPFNIIVGIPLYDVVIGKVIGGA